ncbi:MAG: bifunctional phosphopantothenoylcysteine decarboxylase/phosphopantothenate--cysteine ligase CoaBC [Myxococcales bacterium]|nr:bifunctional phosphopantothenoylcysteine decarboxylase/phosphopantothenate--cysteine ligase CoaBC [Myxococcales bacterium]
MLSGRTIHLCVCGGIAAYKAVELTRLLQKAGATVRVAMTPNAQAFVGPLTFQAITRHPVLTATLDPSEEMQIGHINFAQECDALVVAPATANTLAKAAVGLGDEIVSTVLLAASVPVVAAPAMNTWMYANPAVVENLATLRRRGWRIVEPDAGELACGAVGPGRLVELERIVGAVAEVLGVTRLTLGGTGEGMGGAASLAGRHVVVSAGGTREHIDPVRFIGNPASGRMGFAVAEAAAAAGARVTLVHGPVSIAPPAGVTAVAVTSAQEMHDAITPLAATADAVVMTAAVADWRPETVAATKQKKTDGPLTLTLVRTPDILAALGAARAASATSTRPVLVGFAAETGDPIAAAQGKLARKRVDLVVANDVTAAGSGFGVETNRVWFVEAGGVVEKPLMAKRDLGAAIAAWVAARLAGGAAGEGSASAAEHGEGASRAERARPHEGDGSERGGVRAARDDVAEIPPGGRAREHGEEAQ